VDQSEATSHLVMSWEIHTDGDGAGDDLYFGFWDDASSSGNIYRLTRNTSSATAAAGANFSDDNAFAMRIFKSAGALGSTTWSGTAAGPPYPISSWLANDTRVDVSCPGGTGSACDWALRVRAPIDPAANTADATPTGIKISGSTFHFWYEIQDSATLGTTAYAFPSGLSAATEQGGIPPI